VRIRLVSLPLVAAALVLLASPRASAYERQWHAGADAGLASLFGDHSSGGFGTGAHLAYGLSDVFNAMLELDYTHHSSANTSVWSSGVGLAYTLDVARIVPYAGLLVGGYRLTNKLYTTSPGAQIALGVDYQIDRHWAAGLQIRMHTIFAPDPVGTLAYGTTFLRFEYVWGF
jgi:Outer membrane protein beta-barrel domain